VTPVVNPYANPTIVTLGPGYSSGINWITADSSGNLYLAVSTSDGSALVSVKASQIGINADWNTVTGSDISGTDYESVAVDSSMNMYAVEGVTGDVYKATYSGTYSFNSTPVLTYTGSNPYFNGTVDSSDNLYLLDSGDNNIWKSPATNYSNVANTGYTTQAPWAVNLDPFGNLLISTFDLNSSGADSGVVVKGTYVSSSYSYTALSINGLHQPVDVVENSSGNLYILDMDEYGYDTDGTFPGASTVFVVYEAIPNGNTYTLVKVVDGADSHFGKNTVASIAVDPSGDVFVAEFNSGAGKVIEVKP
jgi:hypothetical protein